LAGESIVVIGKHPAAVSEVVWWLQDMIRPLKAAGEWWPYLTVQNPNFRRLQQLYPTSAKSKPTENTSAKECQRGTTTTLPSRSGPANNSLYLTRASLAQVNIRQAVQQCYMAYSKDGSSWRSRSGSKGNLMPEEATVSSATEGSSTSSIIVGVTNPYFIKAFEGWPNILKIGGGGNHNLAHESVERIKARRASKDKSCRSSKEDIKDIPGKPLAVETRILDKLTLSFGGLRSTSVASTSSSTSRASPRLRQGRSSPSLLDLTPSLSTKYETLLARDKKLISVLMDAYNRGVDGFHPATEPVLSPPTPSIPLASLNNSLNALGAPSSRQKGCIFNEVLRRHFVDLSERFLVPLNRYFGTLIPQAFLPAFRPEGSIYPLHLPSFKMKPFDVRTFLAHLDEHGAPKLVFRNRQARSNWKQLYVRFIGSPHFVGWLFDRKAVAECECRRSYLDKLCQVDISPALRNEDYCLFLFIRIRFELIVHGRGIVAGEDVHELIHKIDHRMPEWFGVGSVEQIANLEKKACTLWQSLNKNIRDRVRSGEFDQFQGAFPDEDDFILVL
jgi:hypothetical protein